MAVSLLHEAPRLPLEERPELLFELLGTPPPEAARVVLASADLTQSLPVERRADAVLTVVREQVVVAAYVVETQLAIDPEKLFTWPLYTAAVHARHRCPTTLVVLTTSAHVAAWARRPSDSFQPGLGFCPRVLEPGDLAVDAADATSASPERAVLGALFASESPRLEEALAAALTALRRVDPVRAASYLDLLTSILGESAMPASPETLQRIKEGIENMRVVHVMTAALKDVMAARGITFTELGRAHLWRCEDQEKVRDYIRRAATATTEAEIFGSDPPLS